MGYSVLFIFVGGFIYCVCEDGMIFVIDVSEEFEIVSKYEFDEYMVVMFVLVNGKILICIFKKLYCISN